MDPALLNLHNSDALKRLTGKDPKALLADPQTLNSYSYARNNPHAYKDEDGNLAFLLPFLMYFPAAYVALNTAWDAVNVGISAYYFSKDQSADNAAFLAGDIAALSNPYMAIKNNSRAELCLSCGYNVFKDLGVYPWDSDLPSDEICPCCGIQFGYQDMSRGKRDEIYAEWRERWTKGGMVWDKGRSKPPKNWNPVEQLKGLSKS